jgi:hypothetical protein
VPSITLTASAPTGAGIALARAERSTASLLVLEVRSSQVTGLYGVAFDLTYPSAVLDYTAFRPGDFLAAGGAAVSIQVFESAPGNLVVGVTRVGDVAGADGSGVLLELELQAVASGSGSLAFRENTAFRADGTPLTVSWAGGSVAVIR